MHSIEVKRFKEEEKRLRNREQEVRNSLEGAHQQVSNLNSELSKLQKDYQVSQLKIKSASQQGVSTTMLMGVQSNMNDQIERMTRVLALIETYYHRITFALSKIKTIKSLHIRDKNTLKNRLNEEIQETRYLREENMKLKMLEAELDLKNRENSMLKNELESAKHNSSMIENRLKLDVNNVNDVHKAEILKIQQDHNNTILETQNIIEAKEIEISEKAKNIEELALILNGANIEIDNLKQEIKAKDANDEKLKDYITNLENDYKRREIDINISYQNQIQTLQEKCENLKDDLKFKESEVFAKEKDIENLQQLMQDELDKEKDFYQKKISKLEQQSRELRRDRDVLFQNLNDKKIGIVKETQTDVPMKYTPVRKTPPPQRAGKIEDLEALSREILDFSDEINYDI